MSLIFRKSAVALTTTLVMAFAGVAAWPASADTRPVNDDPATVSADPLPTTQIDGVAWSQVVVGNKVYVAGSFKNARPAGAAPGTNLTPRSNILAYDINTGVLDPNFAPVLDGQALTIAASPDGKTIYVGGEFGKVNGQWRVHMAAFDVATGQLKSNFQPVVSSAVRTISATNDTVYFGGDFNNVSGVARSFAASVRAQDGGVTDWNPSPNASVTAMAVTSDSSKVVLGGRFTTVSGQNWYGMGATDPVTGSPVRWDATSVLRNAGTATAWSQFVAEGDSVYGAGYTYGSGGNFEGIFRAKNDSGELVTVADSRGDHYSVYPDGPTVYAVSHAHYGGNFPGAFPQTEPWTHYHSTALTADPRGTITSDPYGYPSFLGKPAPAMLNWFPNWYVGSVTPARQAAWSITGNGDYVVAAGEFTGLVGKSQQGLVRFASTGTAPNTVRPSTSDNLTPTVSSTSPGEVRVAWQTTHDRDNEALTYRVYRDYKSSRDVPVYETTVNSRFFARPSLSFVDRGLTPGESHNYRVVALDPFGNSVSSVDMKATVGSAGSPYAEAVLADGPTSYWRLGDATGAAMLEDIAGGDDLQPNGGQPGAGLSQSPDGALTGDADTASTFDGVNSGYAAGLYPQRGPNTVTVEAWVKTTSTSGGRIVGYSERREGTSARHDRQLYLDNGGRVLFGVHSGGVRTIISPNAVNDGQWHHVAGTLGPAGMRLFVDGKAVASRGDTVTPRNFSGYWRVGGDTLSGWTNAPTSGFLSGKIDEVAVYPKVLTPSQVDAHFRASGRTSALPGKPGDQFGAAVFDLSPEMLWRLDDTSGTAAKDSGPANADGTAIGGVTWLQPSQLSYVNSASAAFDGSNDLVVSNRQVMSPAEYTAGVWFNTSTTRGGKLIGFGDRTSGLSPKYDRHVYMQNDGKLAFGPSAAGRIVTDKSFNDGVWHLATLTEGPDGMELFVDGRSVGATGQRSAAAYAGYWRIGGDNTWGSATSAYLAGRLDEAFVLGGAIPEEQVYDLYVAGLAPGTNQRPFARFTSTTDFLTANFDAGASSDPDGTLVSYDWDFGDGSTGTGPSVTKAYGSAGTYTVTLTVTDDRGGVDSVKRQVTTQNPPPNVPPTAAFSNEINRLNASFDATDSSDADGSISSYEWDFGDGTTGTGKLVDKTFAQEGTYTVVLTVTDNRGATAQVSRDVSVQPNRLPTAAFEATANDLAVAVDATQSSDPDGTITSYDWDFGDGTTGNGKQGTHSYASSGTFTVTLTVTDSDGAIATKSADITVTEPPNELPTARFSVGATALRVDLDASASDDPDGTIQSYDWNFGDGATGTGRQATHTYQSAGTYGVTLTVTDNRGSVSQRTEQVSVVSNQVPTADFTSSVTDLTVSLDGRSSSDPDGAIEKYEWDLGDGTTKAGPQVTHTYAAAGSYDVRLTVKDGQGASADKVRKVTVTQPPLARDLFGRSVASGWGGAEIGGSWSGCGSACSVSNGTGLIPLTAGTGRESLLNSVNSTNTDVTADFAVNKTPTGGGTYVSLVGRGGTGEGYRGKARMMPDGSLQMSIVRLNAWTEATLASATLPAGTVTAGQPLRMRVQVSGTAPTTIRFKAWAAGSAEPDAWRLTATDSTAALQKAGGVGVYSYLSGSTSNGPTTVSIDNVVARLP